MGITEYLSYQLHGVKYKIYPTYSSVPMTPKFGTPEPLSSTQGQKEPGSDKET